MVLIMTIARPPDLVLVSEALGNGAALVLTALLILLIVRTARSNFAMWLAAFCALLWSGASLAATLLILAGSTPDSPGVWIAKRAEMVSGGIFPLSFLLLWPVPLPSDSWRATLRKWLLRIGTGVAALTLIALVNVRTPPARGTVHVAMSLVPFVAAILMTFGALSVLQGRLKTPADRVYVFLTLTGMWVSGVSVLALDRFLFSPGICAVLTAVKEQAPFLTLIGTIFFFARFRAADVLIKSSLRILAGSILSFAAALLVSQPIPGSPLAMQVLLKTALLGLMLFFYIAASYAIRFAVDRWVLPRPDYRAALRELWNELNTLDAEQEIFDAARRRVHSVLESRRVNVLPSVSGSEFRDDPDRENDCHIQAPVRVRGERTHLLAVVQERYCRALLSGDIRFLEDAASLIGWRIEALLAERERIERQAHEAKLLQLAAESELKALRAQINPHFLFNSLNTIADLIVTDPAKAETITVLLAKVFRHVLLYSDRQLTAVSEEIEFLRTYLRIEEVRFGPRLTVRMDVDPQVFSARVPSLILQPVVENAIKHGLAPKIGPGHLNIRAGRDGSFIKLEVEDDGVGFSDGAQEGSRRGVGLKIIAERLRTLYKAGASLEFESANALGSRVTILIPVEAEAP
jgi:two-component system, LytTR family, sensor kinase